MEYYSSLAKRRRRENASAASSSTASKNPQNNDDEYHLGQSMNNSSTRCAPKKKPIPKKSFAQRIEDLRVYKDKHGHVNVSKKEDKSLNKFCQNMKQARNNPEKSNVALITDDRIASLDALGFDWGYTKEVKSFAHRIDDLRAYKEKNGHVNVKQSEDKSLNKFCYDIRHARNNPEKSNVALRTDDRIASLDALGFDWGYTKEVKSFAQRIDDLRAYKEKHGHVNVKKSEDKSLYQFCRDIRYARKKPEMSRTAITDDRITSLDALGFDWTLREYAAKKTFEQRIKDLRAHKERHGDVNVKKKEDKSLNKFCKNIRTARNNPEKSNMLINEERIASLDALGFDWTAR